MSSVAPPQHLLTSIKLQESQCVMQRLFTKLNHNIIDGKG